MEKIPPPAPGSLKALLLPALVNKVQNKGTQGARARYDAELPPIISIVQCPVRPVISVPELFLPPFAPGLSLGQTGFVPGTNWASTVKNKEKTWVRPWDKPGLSQGRTQFVPGTNRGSSQSQPEQKFMFMCYSNSVLTLYGLILAPILNLFKLPFLVLGS